MNNNLVRYCIVGMGIGFPVVVLCMILFGGFSGVMAEFLVWMIASALYGILSGIMYDAKIEWPLPALLGIHCLGCLFITLCACLICGYIAGAADLLPILAAFVLIYLAVYALCFFAMKRSEKQINQALKEK